MEAKLRKHIVAIVALAAFHFVFFFPTFFMGRVVSPNDVYYNYAPWAHYKPGTINRVQNSLLNDPPTAYLPLMALLKGDWKEFHWNPYVGSGNPGLGSSGSAVFAPFIFFPALLVPLSWVYTAIIFLKVTVSFWFAYLWLREERLGKRGAAIGAIIIAAAGVYSVRWLWQSTNATALYPALLWIVRRTFAGKRTSIAVVSLIALAYALSGFPSTMAYGAYVALLYAIYLAIRERRIPATPVSRVAVATLLGLLIAAPAIVPFVHFIGRSGYLGIREAMATIHYPLSHWPSFFDPQRLGTRVFKNWVGDRSLGVLNNYIEATIYIGLMAWPLALIGLLWRRARHRWFWLGAATVVLLCMFGIPPIARAIGHLPGIKYTSVARLVLLLPLPLGFLAGSGAALVWRFLRRRSRAAAMIVVCAIAVAAAGDLARFAGTFYPFLRPEDTEIPSTPVIEYLLREPEPFRIAAFLSYLWPNTAELFEIEDIASHFGSESDYRRILLRIDPTAWDGASTVITFNSLKFNFTDPLVSLLGVRFLLEHRTIDIIKWTIFQATVPGVTQTGALTIAPGTIVERTVTIDPQPFWALEIPASVDRVLGASPRLDVELVKDGQVIWARSFAAADLTAMNKVYAPVSQQQRGDRVKLRLWASGMRVRLLKADAPAGEAPLFYGRVTIPVIFERELPDGRIFRNLAELPRFYAVKRLRKMNRDEFLFARDTDFRDTAVITDDPVFPPESIAADAQVRLVRYSPAQQHVETNSSGPFFLASSEKLTPELRVTIDGRRIRPTQINMLFAGVNVPAGKHQIVFSRRIGRGWWPGAIGASIVVLAIGVLEIALALRKR